MATMARLVNSQGRFWRAASQLLHGRVAPLPTFYHKALISTSDKKKDVPTTVDPMENPEMRRLIKHFEDVDQNKEENYRSYGYEPGDRDTDWMMHHFFMFVTVTLGLVGGAFVIAYKPDLGYRHWCHREAFLELERREREGLPLVDPNYVDPSTIELPPDEELGETKIII